MKLTPHNCRMLGMKLDHPECVCLGPDGSIYAGSEAGTIFRIDPSGQQEIVGSTGGFLLGIALDGEGNLHACDIERGALVQLKPDGRIDLRASGVAGRPFSNPNYGAFDQAGNFYLSDSGDYWQQDTGTGYIVVVRADNKTEMFHGGPFLFPNGVAIHPTGKWLYIAQSTASNVVRIPLDAKNGPVEVTHSLPVNTIPDGLAFAADGTLIIACYKPDMILVGYSDGTVEALFDDPTGELLNRPTNVALGDGKIYIANLGGQHITVVETDIEPCPVHRPVLR